MDIDKIIVNQDLSAGKRLSLAAAIFILALAVRFLVLPVESGLAFLIFYPGTAVVALFCGFAASMIYISLAAVAGAIIFIPPYWQTDSEKLVPAIAFWLSATTILYIINSYQRRVFRETIKLTEEVSLRQKVAGQLLESLNFITDLESTFRQTFEHAAVGIAHVAPDGSWLMVNSKICSVIGYEKNELLAKSFTEIIHPEDLVSETQNVKRMLSGEIDTCASEIRCLHKNGVPIWGQLTMSLVRHTDGSPHYFITVVEDIQQRKQADEALRASELLFSTLLEQSPDAIAITANEQGGAIVEVNSAFCALSGYPRKELLALGLSELQLWGNPAQGRATKAMLSLGVPINDLQSDLRCKNGKLIPTSLSAHRIQIR